MKCPKCHSEVEPGSLYCPKCLTEIPWVKEFDSVETLIEKKKREDSGRPPMPPEKPKNPPKTKKSKWTVRRLWGKRRGVVLCALVLACIGLLCYRQLHTFSALYMRAEKAFGKEDYDAALVCTEDALEKQPDNLSANLLLAGILEKQGDNRSAIMVLQPMVEKHRESVQLYENLARLLSYEGRTGEITELLENCEDQKILEACKAYVCAEPVSSLPPGTYTAMQTVELSAEYKRIYYTLDGTMPTQKSPRYADSIHLPEGTTILKAFGINDNNIPSNIITRKYVIVLKSPEPPVITPESGDYRTETKIELEVPDGCRAYYAFDKVPTVQSTEYRQPISMPQGDHTFYAILVAANGKISEYASRNYYLVY